MGDVSCLMAVGKSKKVVGNSQREHLGGKTPGVLKIPIKLLDFPKSSGVLKIPIKLFDFPKTPGVLKIPIKLLPRNNIYPHLIIPKKGLNLNCT